LEAEARHALTVTTTETCESKRSRVIDAGEDTQADTGPRESVLERNRDQSIARYRRGDAFSICLRDDPDSRRNQTSSLARRGVGRRRSIHSE
jgi:hypothetical protein